MLMRVLAELDGQGSDAVKNAVQCDNMFAIKVRQPGFNDTSVKIFGLLAVWCKLLGGTPSKKVRWVEEGDHWNPQLESRGGTDDISAASQWNGVQIVCGRVSAVTLHQPPHTHGSANRQRLAAIKGCSSAEEKRTIKRIS
jgi:hypothetical protein